RTSWRPGRCAASCSAARASSRSSSTIRGSCTGCCRPRPVGCAVRTSALPPRSDRGLIVADERPYPPGEYPIVIVGSGPGALQTSYFLRRLGIEHAVISGDAGPGGMFRKWPFFQRLLSWTKPYAPADRASRDFERWDWNSLLALEPELRGIATEFMDGTSDFPSRPDMQANLEAFAERTGVAVRYGCRWESTRHEETADGVRFVLVTSDGEYRCRYPIFAVGVAEPYAPATPGIELAVHY